MKFCALFAAALLACVLAGCNTVKGVGQDIQKAGESIENAVKKK
jgi:predicted small secreted protein